MTLSANVVPSSRNVTVRMNYGTVQFECTEDYAHVESFLSSLQSAIAVAKAYAESQDSHER